MRLDKLISEMGRASRKEAALAVRKGLVFVNKVPAKKADIHVDPDKDEIIFCGETLVYRKHTYIIMNKPCGYVSVTEARDDIPALVLLPEELQRIGLFPAGRLDKNTSGLLFLTNDGETGHRLTSPKHHVEKEYAFTVKYPISEDDVRSLEAGVMLDDGYVTMPCRVVMHGEREGSIILREGKYHQIKRMMQAVHNSITSLKRIRYGILTLDGIEEGGWRYLTEDEEKTILQK